VTLAARSERADVNPTEELGLDLEAEKCWARSNLRLVRASRVERVAAAHDAPRVLFVKLEFERLFTREMSQGGGAPTHAAIIACLAPHVRGAAGCRRDEEGERES
jgi:hypothetical protein